MENNTTQPKVENQAKNDTSKNATVQTNEGGDADVVKQEEQVDYKAELEALQSRLVKKDEIIGHKNRAIDSLKRKFEENGIYDRDQISAFIENETSERIKQVVEEKSMEVERLKESLIWDVVDEEVASLAKSYDEAELIKFYMKNVLKYGSSKSEIREAVKTAWLKANEKKILSTNKELAQALMSKATTNTSPNTAGEKTSTPDKQKYTGEDKEFLSKYGVKV